MQLPILWLILKKGYKKEKLNGHENRVHTFKSVWKTIFASAQANNCKSLLSFILVSSENLNKIFLRMNSFKASGLDILIALAEIV